MSNFVSGPARSTRDLVIVGIGDSHLNGNIPIDTTAAGDPLGVFAWTSPKDRQWNGAGGYNAVFSANGAINVTTGSNDNQIALSTTNGSPLTQIPSLLRQSYPNLGYITMANLAVGGSSSYTWGGEPAFGYIGHNGTNANDGDTVTIDGVVYTFRTAPSVAFDVTIGASANASIQNLGNAVNLEGTTWGAGTTQHPTVFYPAATATQYGRFVALTTGTAGNSIATAGSSTARICPYRNDLVPLSTSTFGGGLASAALFTNAVSKLSGIGTVDAFVVTLGTNDAARAGYRGRKTQDALTKLVADINTNFPGAKIIFWKPMPESGTAGTYITSAVVPAVAAVAAANPSNVSFIDFNALGTGTSSTATRLLSSDGVHATAYGYSVMSQMFAAQIASALGLTW
jgi:lysophospholipase L1-like esterase